MSPFCLEKDVGVCQANKNLLHRIACKSWNAIYLLYGSFPKHGTADCQTRRPECGAKRTHREKTAHTRLSGTWDSARQERGICGFKCVELWKFLLQKTGSVMTFERKTTRALLDVLLLGWFLLTNALFTLAEITRQALFSKNPCNFVFPSISRPLFWHKDSEVNKMRPIDHHSCVCTLRGGAVVHTVTRESDDTPGPRSYPWARLQAQARLMVARITIPDDKIRMSKRHTSSLRLFTGWIPVMGSTDGWLTD